jgi:lipopolysaccharide export system permease protein
MRAAGVSVAQIGWAVMKAGLVLMLAVAVLTEFIVPPLQQLAYERQLMTMGRIRALRTDQGFWSRDGMRFINIRKIRNGRIPTDINIYEFDEKGRLLNLIHADSADIVQRDNWLLNEVWRKTLNGQNITTERLPSESWQPFLSDAQIQALQYPADSLSPSDLDQYIHYLQAGGQDIRPYELQLWQKLALPFTTGAMVLLSIPFVFGLPRLTNAGQRILSGAIIGIVLYFLNQVIANLGMLLDLNTPLLVLSPVVFILGFAGWLFRRV